MAGAIYTVDLGGGDGLVSSNGTPEVATIDPSGIATGLSPGQRAITATAGLISGNTTLTVRTPVAQLRYDTQQGVVAGRLRACHGILLTQFLYSAALRIARGRPASALVLLTSFINCVINLRNSGALSPGDALALINEANSVVDGLGT